MVSCVQEPKKLVFEYSYSKDNAGLVAPEHALASAKWFCKIVYIEECGAIEEIELEPCSKMLLSDFIPYVRDQFKAMIPDASVDCGFKIYRFIKKKRR